MKLRFKLENGQDMIEYALILGIVAIAGAAALIGMGGSIDSIWGIVNQRLSAAGN
jgi:Flp pilus assembly pilin Flp